ncbi:MAG: CBS domain-containing protein [Planctomycetaceae bacterium]|nr:CBS domain-containing protein [Planctomycetaceae bacterium]
MSELTVDRLHEPVLQHARQDFVRVLSHHTVGEALRYVQQHPVEGRIVYFYVVDDDNRLKGVVPTRRLLLNPPEKPIAEIMVSDVIAVPHTATLRDACETLMSRRLLALPIVDDDRKLRGIIDVDLYRDEVTDLIRSEEQDDLFQLIGVHLASVQQASIPVVFGKRFPWLLCNVGGGLGCAVIAGLFQPVLDQVIALALFIPVVLALAESVSIQTLTLTLQSQHGPSKSPRSMLGNLVRELPVGGLLGLACGGVVAVTCLLWQRLPAVAFCLLASISLSITTATLFGLLVPSLLRAARRDPKVASGPITLAMTDLATMCIYLGLATWILS